MTLQTMFSSETLNFNIKKFIFKVWRKFLKCKKHEVAAAKLMLPVKRCEQASPAYTVILIGQLLTSINNKHFLLNLRILACYSEQKLTNNRLLVAGKTYGEIQRLRDVNKHCASMTNNGDPTCSAYTHRPPAAAPWEGWTRACAGPRCSSASARRSSRPGPPAPSSPPETSPPRRTRSGPVVGQPLGQTSGWGRGQRVPKAAARGLWCLASPTAGARHVTGQVICSLLERIYRTAVGSLKRRTNRLSDYNNHQGSAKDSVVCMAQTLCISRCECFEFKQL